MFSNKNKITLGLLVFFVGFLMAACGSKNNTANTTTTNNEIPKDFEDFNFECSDRCTRKYNGKFYIASEDLYLQAFDHTIASNNLFGDSLWNQSAGNLAIALLNPDVDFEQCGKVVLFSVLASQLLDIDDTNVLCTSDGFDEGSFGGGFGNDDVLRSKYTAKVELIIENNRVSDIRLTIASNVDGNGNDVVIFRSTGNDNIFESDDGRLQLGNSNGRLRMITSGGGYVGYFQRN